MTVIILLESLAYYICIFAILKNIYQLTPESKRSIYTLLLFYIPLFIASFTISKDISNLMLLLVIPIDLIYLKYVFREAKIQLVICAFVILYSINISVSSIVKLITNMPSGVLANETISISMQIIISILCIIICKTKQFYISSRLQLIPSSVKRITMLSLIASSFAISLVSDYSAVKNFEKWGRSIQIALIILIIIVGTSLPILIANSIGKSFYSEQSKNFEQQIQIQAEYYKVLSKSNYELRKFRHDYKNMRIGVTKYIQDGSFEEAEQMLNNCDSLLTLTTKSLIKFDTGNGIVDAILTEKQEKATKVNTVITFVGVVTSNAISATDLCVIFGNTLDNAIEACEKLQADEEKIISITCKRSREFMFLTITNPIEENVEIHNNTILTSKQDKSNHGFGIYSIQKIVDKYNGELTLSCENSLFKTEIVLNI